MLKNILRLALLSAVTLGLVACSGSEKPKEEVKQESKKVN